VAPRQVSPPAHGTASRLKGPYARRVSSEVRVAIMVGCDGGGEWAAGHGRHTARGDRDGVIVSLMRTGGGSLFGYWRSAR
jgi:hypothetical protein